jgi:microcystin-dependent protein
MSQSYTGEIRMFAGDFNPQGWAFCDGSLLPISENETLFNLIGTTYGGDGENTFALPDLRGRVPVSPGGLANLQIGETAGVETVTLSVQQIPAHSHPFLATTTNSNDANPNDNMLSQATTFDPYQSSANPNPDMSPPTLGMTGGSQPHENMQPYLCISFIISLYGIYPQPN